MVSKTKERWHLTYTAYPNPQWHQGKQNCQQRLKFCRCLSACLLAVCPPACVGKYCSQNVSTECGDFQDQSEMKKRTIDKFVVNSVFLSRFWNLVYHKTCNIKRNLLGNEIVDHSIVIGASPVGAAPIESLFSTWHLDSVDWAKSTARRNEKHFIVGIWCHLYKRFHSTGGTTGLS